jgi:hypothetical protein
MTGGVEAIPMTGDAIVAPGPAIGAAESTAAT